MNAEKLFEKLSNSIKNMSDEEIVYLQTKYYEEENMFNLPADVDLDLPNYLRNSYTTSFNISFDKNNAEKNKCIIFETNYLDEKDDTNDFEVNNESKWMCVA